MSQLYVPDARLLPRALLHPNQFGRAHPAGPASPQLLAAYEHKERFYHIWDCTNRRGAEQALATWIDNIPPGAEGGLEGSRQRRQWLA